MVAHLLSSLVGYVSFSVIHDSIHRAISSILRVNDGIGQVGMLMVLPYVDVRLFRWAHILHRHFASPAAARQSAARRRRSLSRWMAIDAIYFVYALRHGDKVSKPYLRTALMMSAVVAVVVATLISGLACKC